MPLAALDGLPAWPDGWPNAWQAAMAAWAFIAGTAIGSFLNVVIYRLPAGMSVVHPPSHCPRCKRPIRWYDNLPVLSWFVLRGKCRHCGTRFSGRYALVEFLSGAALAALALAGPLARYPSMDAMLAAPHWQMTWGRVAFAAVPLAALWCAALIRYDGHRPPLRLATVPLAIGLGLGTILPNLIVEPHRAILLANALANFLPGGPLTAWLGAIVGGLCGAMISPLLARADERARGGWSAVIWGGVLGAFFNYLAALILLAAAALCAGFALVSAAKATSNAIAGLWRFGLAAGATAIALMGV